jgi:hypothetical protein
MEQIKMIGQITIGGKSFEGLEGGFGEDKKCILARDIADIHGKQLKHINEAINNNRERFIDNKDIVDLKVVDLVDYNLNDLGFSKMQISKSKNLYVLSERGYSKLLKILEDDTAWEIYDQLVDEYFTMRKIIKEVEPLLTEEQKLQLAIFNAPTKEDAVIASADLDRYRKQQIAGLEGTIQDITTHALTIENSRQVINKLMRKIVAVKNSSFATIWGDFYSKINYQLHINIKARGKTKIGKSTSYLNSLTEEETYKVEQIVRTWANELKISIDEVLKIK